MGGGERGEGEEKGEEERNDEERKEEEREAGRSWEWGSAEVFSTCSRQKA